jgi:type I restriction enzyme S subunit
LQGLNLSLIPNSWAWTNIYEISESMKNGIYKKQNFYNDNGIACLRMYNIDRGCIVWKDIKRMQLTSEEIREYGLRPGDILINRVNSRELVGKAAVIRNNPEPCVFESKNIRLRLMDKSVNSQFLNVWFLIFNQKYFNHNAQQTVGMASINQDQLGSMPVPLPPLSEQQIIVKKTESLLGSLTELEDAIIKSQNYSGCLRQSILKLAFEGKLVPQNSYDEPAFILLERIKAERANNAIRKSCRIKRSNTHQMRLTQ